jgi:hypothetical protein
VFGHWFETVFGAQPDALKRLDHAGEIGEAMESCAAGRGAIACGSSVPPAGPVLQQPAPVGAWRGAGFAGC